MAAGNDSDSYSCWDQLVRLDEETSTTQIFPVLMAVPCLLANIAVIVTVLCTETLRKQNFNMWVVSLAFADILFAITAIVINVLTIYNYKFENENYPNFWITYNNAVSYYTFIGMNLDRTISIKKPLQSYGQTDSSFFKKIFASWVLALLPALPYLWDTTMPWCEKHCSSCPYIPVDNKPLMWWHIIAGCLAPMMIIFTVWVVIFLELRKTTIAVKADSRRDKENRHVITVMGIMTLAFIICTFPLTISLISYAIWRPSTFMWLSLSYTACFIQSILNPIFYLGVCKPARQAFIALICCRSYSA
eukprot:GFUD01012702.1.p1 GENE.GFUD01012702.1~~GFUD01012702.1.p1  ORF type:complete len:304 (+),score=32.87 GFUD01012702.1:40-951(+)